MLMASYADLLEDEDVNTEVCLLFRRAGSLCGELTRAGYRPRSLSHTIYPRFAVGAVSKSTGMCFSEGVRVAT